VDDEWTLWLDLRHVVCIEFDEDALTRTHFRGTHDRKMIALFNPGEAAGTAWIIQCDSTFRDIGDAIFELDKHVGTVIDAQSITCAQVLVDPHAHRANVTAVRRLCAKQCNEIDRNEHDIARHRPPRNRTLSSGTETRTWRPQSTSEKTDEKQGERHEQCE
jgi:hypothetical protein